MRIVDLSSTVDASAEWEANPVEHRILSPAEGAAHMARQMRENWSIDFDVSVLPDGELLSLDTFTLTSHTGTHVDAPSHYGSSADYGVPSIITGTTAVGAQPQYSAKVNSLSAMANLYADLGTWYGVTPYVGGGIGVSQLKSVDYVDTSMPGALPTEPGKALNFSWALMAGVAYQVTPSWMIDVGYRYLQLGDLPGIDGAGTTNNAAVFKNLSAHEARIGFRFLLD